MNCKQYRTEIEGSDFAAGHGNVRAESHAAACAECHDFAGGAATLRRLVAGLARVDAPADFEFRLRARIAAAESARARPWSRTLLPRAVWLAAAGCLALAAALALQTRNSRTPGTQGAAARETTAQRTTARPASEQSPANPIADASAGVASRGASGERAGEDASGEPAPSMRGSGKTVVTPRGAGAASVAANAARESQRRPAAVAAAQPLREAVASGVEKAAPAETNTSSMTGAPVVVSTAIPLPVSADEQPLRVLFKDVQGASRVVNVEPLAFGSNEPAAKPTNVTFTKTTKKQGVW